MSQFDIQGKPPAWHTAFYYLAEHVRSLTCGKMNHKRLYALVGTDGGYLNHSNPTVRKRTAGALSRIVHSQAYAKDMRDRHQQNYSAFAKAAQYICGEIRAAQNWDDARLLKYLQFGCWPDVRLGLHNELLVWRSDLNLAKADIEMSMLFESLVVEKANDIDVRLATGSAIEQVSDGCSDDDASEIVLAALLHVLAYGCFNTVFARDLLDRYPTENLVERSASNWEARGACLVKFVDAAHSALVGSWRVGVEHPFSIGRYTDCDIVETDKGVSRVHCFIYYMGGIWHFEDRKSLNGSRVERSSIVVYDSKRDGSGKSIELKDGDVIVLASCSYYWFGAFAC